MSYTVFYDLAGYPTDAESYYNLESEVNELKHLLDDEKRYSCELKKELDRLHEVTANQTNLPKVDKWSCLSSWVVLNYCTLFSIEIFRRKFPTLCNRFRCWKRGSLWVCNLIIENNVYNGIHLCQEKIVLNFYLWPWFLAFPPLIIVLCSIIAVFGGEMIMLDKSHWSIEVIVVKAFGVFFFHNYF